MLIHDLCPPNVTSPLNLCFFLTSKSYPIASRNLIHEAGTGYHGLVLTNIYFKIYFRL